MTPRAPRHGGFTLVEVLLALSIFAILLVLLLGGFSGAARTLDVLKAKERSLRQAASALDRISTDLAGAVDTARTPSIHFECRETTLAGYPASSLQFAAFTLPDAASGRPSTDLCKVKYVPRISEGGNSLDLLRERSDLPLVESRIPSREGRIAMGIRGFEVELYDGKEWGKAWPPGGGESRGNLPSMAAITVVDAEGRRFRRIVSLPLAGKEADLLHSGRRTADTP